MFVGEYTHEQQYFDFETNGAIPDEGILKGKEGEFTYRSVKDGYAIFDTNLLNSGFVYPGSVDDIFVPRTINGIPVTELHQTVFLEAKRSFAIEHGNLERVYLEVGKKTLEQQMKESENGLGALLLYMLREEKMENQEENAVEVDFYFCGSRISEMEYCSISCDQSLILHIPNVKTLDVRAHKTKIRGEVPDCVERISFSGKVYPYMEGGWDYDAPNNRCFEGKKNLRSVDGSMSGEFGWSFHNCSNLETVHLSNGIKEIPAYAFSGCESLIDLYVPDSVEAIGAFAFSDCEKLCSIHLPSTLIKITKGMFSGCKSLKKVFLSDSIEVIEENAFSGCSNLKKPWIPKNIKFVAENAFPNSEW